MINKYDLIIIGSGPGGYIAAVRGSQLGMKVLIIEKEYLGGTCLNWGCIPIKSLLKSATVFNYIKNCSNYGVFVNKGRVDFKKVIKRSRSIVNNLRLDIKLLLKNNNIKIIYGFGLIKSNNIIEVVSSIGQKINTYYSNHIIIATGGISLNLDILPINNIDILDYKGAMLVKNQPKSILIIGAGVIGIEFAYFYNSIGTEVVIVERMDRVAIFEDKDISIQLKKIFIKLGIKILLSSQIVNTIKHKKNFQVNIKNLYSNIFINCDIILSSIGVGANLKNLGLKNIGIKVQNKKILVDKFYRTNIKGIYCIGDMINSPSLAHIASAEGIICVEKIFGINISLLNYNNIPSCIYCQPEIASVGYTEELSKKLGYKIRVGKFYFSSLGKSRINDSLYGFIKIIFEDKYGELLGAHMIGDNVTEIVSEVVLARKLETTAYEIINTVHPHPSISEGIFKAVYNAYSKDFVKKVGLRGLEPRTSTLSV